MLTTSQIRSRAVLRAAILIGGALRQAEREAGEVRAILVHSPQQARQVHDQLRALMVQLDRAQAELAVIAAAERHRFRTEGPGLGAIIPARFPRRGAQTDAAAA